MDDTIMVIFTAVPPVGPEIQKLCSLLMVLCAVNDKILKVFVIFTLKLIILKLFYKL